MESFATGVSTPPVSTAPTTRAEVSSAAVRAGPANVEHECMTARELASWMRVNRKTVYEYAARNVIPCRRLGRRLVFSRAAVVAWLARSSTVNTAHNLR